MSKPAIHAAGCGGLLLDASFTSGGFDELIQQRIWRLAEMLAVGRAQYRLQDIVPGINNLLVLFDPLMCAPSEVRTALAEMWEQAQPSARTGRLLEVPVVYGGRFGVDLAELANAAGLSIREYARHHSEAEYRVACIGAMTGFPYLTGLPQRLHFARRATPRTNVPKGSVIVGGAQAGVLPVSAPSGWHAIGGTELELFDLLRAPPCLMHAGDRVRFRIQGIEA